MEDIFLGEDSQINPTTSPTPTIPKEIVTLPIVEKKKASQLLIVSIFVLSVLYVLPALFLKKKFVKK